MPKPMEDLLLYLAVFKKEKFWVLRRWLKMRHPYLTEDDIMLIFEILSSQKVIFQDNEYIVLNEKKFYELIKEKDEKELGIDMIYPS